MSAGGGGFGFGGVGGTTGAAGMSCDGAARFIPPCSIASDEDAGVDVDDDAGLD